ncbi:MAG: hypothetical protein M3340_08625 [Actinomycetota bacterium]|nr:hypothetical protein [Actinomycetota bacterium]
MDVVALLGEFPVGDPAGMRRAARRLHVQAERIRTVGERAAQGADATAFECAAADRFRSVVRDIRAGCIRDAERVHAAADYLSRAASRLEGRQAEWRRAAARLQQEV